MFKNLSIKLKMVYLIMLVSVIPLIFLSTYSIYIASNERVENRINSLKAIANSTADNIENQFVAYSQLLDYFSCDANVKGAFENKFDEDVWMVKSFENVVQKYDDISQIYLGLIDERFYIIPKEEMSENFDLLARPWYKTAIGEKGKNVINEPYVDDISSEMIITLSKTVEKDGKVIGVLGLDIDPENMHQKISDIKLSESGFVFVINQEGTIYFHPDKKKIGENIANEDWFLKIKGSDKGKFEYKYDGIDKVAAYKTTKQGLITIVVEDLDYVEVGIIKLIKTIILIGLAVIVFAIFSALIITKKYFIQPIKIMQKAISELGEGYLTAKADWSAKDEFGQMATYLNRTILSLRTIVQELTNDSELMKTESEKLFAFSQDIKEIEDYAGAISGEIEGVSATVEEMTAGVEEVATNAQQVSQAVQELGVNAEEAFGTANSGEKSVITVVESMKGVTADTRETAQIVERVAKHAQNIEEILETVQAIAEQTNLLALNAAIEAARAGETGRGFAVVAEEIRKLAEESRSAVEKIASILNSIQAGAQQANNATNQVEENVVRTNEEVKELASHFREIVKRINNVMTMTENIAASTEEQGSITEEMASAMDVTSTSVETVTEKVEDMASAIKEQVQVTEKISDSSKEINNLAQRLQGIVSKFKVN